MATNAANDSLSASEERLLIAEAEIAQRNAYIPYSNFGVGAAILNGDGQIFRGANVENASYGATICAERSAICSAIAALGPAKFSPKAICVVTDLSEPGAPCGICRQTLIEFGDLMGLLQLRLISAQDRFVAQTFKNGASLCPTQQKIGENSPPKSSSNGIHSRLIEHFQK